ncbi:hypothetical protein [Xanthomonas graminis]|uniref:Uncharacterized protein n=1 Tax=Xanthomonas graminis pv. phlei TaxID=487906 RepID=A0A0K2ZTE3_9XANT|nr:hypothetical protein [Xanthomonas translucens]UKE65935.1 hypothetical protein KM547_00765 [Xanthomonas translucens pv. phlei]UKE73567.1 hypothetical protein KFS85_00950 [Xanthomonas translucens pv. phleipratensis]CTP89026.1 hypothetical protein XTPLMG730_2330 [Xanthomonas translucens pv. phlei]
MSELLLQELRGTWPLSVMMAEKVQAPREWARARCRRIEGAAFLQERFNPDLALPVTPRPRLHPLLTEAPPAATPRPAR